MAYCGWIPDPEESLLKEAKPAKLYQVILLIIFWLLIFILGYLFNLYY